MAISSFSSKEDRYFKIDLDTEPEERFKDIMPLQKEEINSAINNIILKMAPKIKAYLPLLRPISKLQVKSLGDQGKELAGMAKQAEVDVTYLVVLNLWQTFDSACTSVVIQNEKGDVMHGRNLDFDFIEQLKPLAAKLDQVRGNTVVFRSISLMGMIGVFTGTKPNMFGVSENERNVDRSLKEGLQNVIVSMMLYRGKLLSLSIREALENASSFDDAVKRISADQVMAPGYVTISGTKKDEGVVITKGRIHTDDVQRLDAQSSRWQVLETNWDRWQTPGDGRRQHAMDNLTK